MIQIFKACGPFLLESLPVMKSLVIYLKNVRAEMTHVVWPDRNQAVRHTILIVLISAFVALLISGLDYVFTGVVAKLLVS